MNKLAIQETFPPGIVGREIVLAQMCHHYRRISTAKARVDTNLFKPPKLSLSRPLSAEVASIVQRSLSPRSPPKHRRCLKYEHEIGEHHIKPSTRSQTAESRLRLTPEVYHPAVKSPKTTHHDNEGQQQATQTSLENSLIDEPTPKTKDEAVQTSYPGLYRPLDARSVQFLRDITTEALHRRAFTSSALNRIFLDHQFRNTYSLTQELMERELEELRRQLGMLPRYHSNGTTVSDGEALDALDTLVLDPRIKEQVIHSLRLSRNNDAKRQTYRYFDRLREDTGYDLLPSRDKTNTVLNNILKSTEQMEDSPSNLKVDEMSHETENEDGITNATIADQIQMPEGGWNAEIIEDDRDFTTASSSKVEGEEDNEKSDEEKEEVESVIDSEDEVEDIQSNSGSSVEEVQSESDDENEDEITQRRSTSGHVTDEHSNRNGSNVKSTHDVPILEPSESPLSRYDQMNADKESNLQPMKLEPLTARDKWRSSLDIVKEESDSTTGQVSNISTASTPTEIESKQDRTKSGPLENLRASVSSSTFFSAQNSLQIKKNTMDESVVSEETLRSSTASEPDGNQTSSSMGGKIVRQMDDSLLSSEEEGPATVSNASLGQIVKHMSDLSDSHDAKKVIHKKGNPSGSANDVINLLVEDNKSETGSEVESVHSDSEDEEEAESSEVSSVHTE